MAPGALAPLAPRGARHGRARSGGAWTLPHARVLKGPGSPWTGARTPRWCWRASPCIPARSPSITVGCSTSSSLRLEV